MATKRQRKIAALLIAEGLLSIEISNPSDIAWGDGVCGQYIEDIAGIDPDDEMEHGKIYSELDDLLESISKRIDMLTGRKRESEGA